MRLDNLTRTTVALCGPDGRVVARQAPAASPAWRSEERHLVEVVEFDDGVSVPLYDVVLGSVVRLPAPEAGVLRVVARPVAEALRGRDDVVVPYDLVRNEAGLIVGCGALARLRSPW